VYLKTPLSALEAAQYRQEVQWTRLATVAVALLLLLAAIFLLDDFLLWSLICFFSKLFLNFRSIISETKR
jgi:hypothetical protein